MAKKYAIGIVIAAKNAEPYLQELLNSIHGQTLAPNQVVVVDDGSSDETYKIVEQWVGKIPSLQIIQTASRGVAFARNSGNSICNTDFIAVLDADDLFLSDTIASYQEFLIKNPDCDLVYADCKYFVRGNVPRVRMSYPQFKSGLWFKRRILGAFRVPFKHSSIVYRKMVWEELGGYDSSLSSKVDVDLFLKFLTRGKKISHLKKVTAFHRKHRHQMSASERMQGIRNWFVLINRYESNWFFRPILKLSRFFNETLKFLVRA